MTTEQTELINQISVATKKLLAISNSEGPLCKRLNFHVEDKPEWTRRTDNPTCVVTSINPPTKAVKELSRKINTIVMGDLKTPKDWQCDYVSYFDSANCLGLTSVFPDNHYARKNLGYLIAIKHKATAIYDTDDDNIPNDNWKIRESKIEANKVVGAERWCNVYSIFHDAKIWPRGFSLTHLNESRFNFQEAIDSFYCPIQQGLADGDPDVDAIWRLTNSKETKFTKKQSVVLSQKLWCPFNSQSTWWFPEAYPLLYLPVYAPFRMTDIWRSFVAQRCLWEMGYGVAFHSPSEVYQERNPHDLLKDFEDEIPGYLNNDKIVEALSGLELGCRVFENMISCYGELVKLNILPEKEIDSLNLWITDIKKIWK